MCVSWAAGCASTVDRLRFRGVHSCNQKAVELLGMGTDQPAKDPREG